MLELPDIRQSADYDCGCAAVDTALRFFGVRTCAAVLDLATPIDGTSPAAIEGAFRRAGLAVQSGRMDVGDLKYHVSRGRPVLCPVALYGGHWVVVRGASAGRRGRVYFHCPACGPQWLATSQWESNWRDTTRAGHDFDAWGIAVG